MSTLSPPVHRGMRELDRSAFAIRVPLLAASVPAPRCRPLLNQVERCGLDFPISLRADADEARPSPSPASNASPPIDPIRLAGSYCSESLTPLDALPSQVRHALEAESAIVRPYTLELGYNHWTASDILHAILPEELLDEAPSSFATVGHIAHLNLRDEYLPHRQLIAQVILDKNPNIRTVVNKLDTIDHRFRFFNMEVLAGEDRLDVELHEHGLRYRFNFSEVYWNTRLSTEHLRLVELFRPRELIVDAFAGVGPFALPAVRKGCFVFASDLNPASARSLAGNVKLNRLGSFVRCGEADGRDWIRQSTIEAWDNPFMQPARKPSARSHGVIDPAAAAPSAPAPLPPPPPPPRLISHFVMNLPASALTFLDAYRGLYLPLLDRPDFDIEAARARTPMVHVYCFSRASTAAEATPDICERASASLGHPVGAESLDRFGISLVRTVAPASVMYRLSFALPWEVLTAR